MKVFFSPMGLFLIAGSLFVSCSTPDYASKDTRQDKNRIHTGYSSQSESNKTTAVSHQEITGEESSTTMADLFSKVPGVTVIGSGRNLSIQVRGRKTFMGETQPLFVLDDRIMGYGYETVSFLEPSMVKSISVLKDGASSAAYGARGANGVIIIKLK